MHKIISGTGFSPMSEQHQQQHKLNPYKILSVIYHIPNFLRLLYRLFHDPRVPFFPKLTLIGAVIYIVSPYDLVPDFLFPFLGFVEDFIILFFVLRIFVKYSPREVVWEHVRTIEQRNRGHRS